RFLPSCERQDRMQQLNDNPLNPPLLRGRWMVPLMARASARVNTLTGWSSRPRTLWGPTYMSPTLCHTRLFCLQQLLINGHILLSEALWRIVAGLFQCFGGHLLSCSGIFNQMQNLLF